VALGTDVNLVALSCGAPGDCTVGGFYGRKDDDEPFLATQKNRAWGKTERVPGGLPGQRRGIGRRESGCRFSLIEHPGVQSPQGMGSVAVSVPWTVLVTVSGPFWKVS
jgi:hypothetical protein